VGVCSLVADSPLKFFCCPAFPTAGRRLVLISVILARPLLSLAYSNVLSAWQLLPPFLSRRKGPFFLLPFNLRGRAGYESATFAEYGGEVFTFCGAGLHLPSNLSSFVGPALDHAFFEIPSVPGLGGDDAARVFGRFLTFSLIYGPFLSGFYSSSCFFVALHRQGPIAVRSRSFIEQALPPSGSRFANWWPVSVFFLARRLFSAKDLLLDRLTRSSLLTRALLDQLLLPPPPRPDLRDPV